MCQITIQTGEGTRIVTAGRGRLLGEVLRENIPAFAMPCAGNHTCGKCKVKVTGAVAAPDEAELRLLSEAERADGVRLACGCRVEGGVTVTLRAEGTSKIVSWYETPAFARTGDGYGFAVDIGTTTVALQLVDRASGRVLAERLAENAQRGYGADVISRMEACKDKGVSVLSGSKPWRRNACAKPGYRRFPSRLSPAILQCCIFMRGWTRFHCRSRRSTCSPISAA